MKQITGSKKIDIAVRIGGIVLIGWGGYQLYQTIKKFNPFDRPTGQVSNIPTPPGCALSEIKKSAIAKQMDKIYNALNGLNFLVYPEIVNVVIGYNDCELIFANDYYLESYGETLYQSINGEWDGTEYDAAINRLVNGGLNDGPSNINNRLLQRLNGAGLNDINRGYINGVKIFRA